MAMVVVAFPLVGVALVNAGLPSGLAKLAAATVVGAMTLLGVLRGS